MIRVYVIWSVWVLFGLYGCICSWRWRVAGCWVGYEVSGIVSMRLGNVVDIKSIW